MNNNIFLFYLFFCYKQYHITVDSNLVHVRIDFTNLLFTYLFPYDAQLHFLCNYWYFKSKLEVDNSK